MKWLKLQGIDICGLGCGNNPEGGFHEDHRGK